MFNLSPSSLTPTANDFMTICKGQFSNLNCLSGGRENERKKKGKTILFPSRQCFLSLQKFVTIEKAVGRWNIHICVIAILFIVTSKDTEHVGNCCCDKGRMCTFSCHVFSSFFSPTRWEFKEKKTEEKSNFSNPLIILSFLGPRKWPIFNLLVVFCVRQRTETCVVCVRLFYRKKLSVTVLIAFITSQTHKGER